MLNQELKVDVMYCHLKKNTNRSGLTLVEMMVSVALTLMVVFAMVRIFESLGNNVTDGRAMIDMSGNLRAAAQMLRSDLEGLTVTTTPPRSPEDGEGYLEIIDGPGTDYQHVVYQASNFTPQLVSAANQTDSLDDDGYLDSEYDTTVGDVDDVLAFTSRRQEPFSGTLSDPRVYFQDQSANEQLRTSPIVIESNEAEIVWWLEVQRNVVGDLAALRDMSIDDQIRNAVTFADDETTRITATQRYPNFSNLALGTAVRSLHRRALLIRPDIDFSEINENGLTRTEVAAFVSNNDLSVRIEKVGDTDRFRLFANSLKDLTNRSNRSFRRGPLSHFTPALVQKRIDSTRLDSRRVTPSAQISELLVADSLLLMHGSMKDMVMTYPQDAPRVPNALTMIMLRRGKDVVLSDVTAFDLRVWDPEAVLLPAAGTIVSPGDPMYTRQSLSTISDVSVAPKGAFVDLGFAIQPKLASPLTVPFQGNFGGESHTLSQLPVEPSATYCTWSDHYETDGYDQDGNNLPDQGTDGLDNNNLFGVDDPSEVETSPPYPHPLRGMSVTMRILDPETRQVRQTSVVTDFLPE